MQLYIFYTIITLLITQIYSLNSETCSDLENDGSKLEIFNILKHFQNFDTSKYFHEELSGKKHHVRSMYVIETHGKIHFLLDIYSSISNHIYYDVIQYIKDYCELINFNEISTYSSSGPSIGKQKYIFDCNQKVIN
jgi:hypothetical protein